MSTASAEGTTFETRYCDALIAYADAEIADETQRMTALELGRAAIAQRYGLLDLLALHQASVASLVDQISSAGDLQERLTRANEFLTQAAAPFEMAYRGWHALADSLRLANEDLEQRIAERTAAHRQAEERLQRAQQIAGIGSWELTPEIGQLTWSKELNRICGLREKPGQSSAHDIATLVHEDDRKQYDTWLAQIKAEQAPGPMEFRIRRPDGECRVLLAEGEATVADGTVSRISCTLQDVTERKAADARFEELQAELIHVSRLSELGQMVSALAHEVNQPLTAQLNYLNAARRLLAAGNQEAVSQALQRIAEQTDRARQIVRHMRDFLRKGEPQRRIENVRTTIEEAAALALIGIGQGVELDIHVADDAVQAVINKVQIQQVLFNLLRNAAEAMSDSARRELSITAVRVGNLVEISVVDTGPGVSEQLRDRLFQPFVTSKANGMGIGLWVCRGIVEAHGGELHAANADGGGAVFRLTIPCPGEELQGITA